MKYLATILLGVATLAGAAQDLSKEITVDHDIIPEKRAAAPLTLRPSVSLTPFRAASLTMLDGGVAINPVSTAVTLSPAAYGDTIATSLHRGYVAAGYFPLWNASLSAGYRFIDNDRTRLNAWMQYGGNAYSSTVGMNATDGWIRRNTLTVGGLLHHAIGRKSNLEVAADYGLDRFNFPFEHDLLQYNTVNKLHLTGVFSSNSDNDIHWFVGTSYALFRNRKQSYRLDENEPSVNGVCEHNIRIHAGGDTPLSETSAVGVDAVLDILAYNTSALMIYDGFDGIRPHDSMVKSTSPGTGMGTLRPYYELATDRVKLRLGARIDLGSCNGAFFHIAPEVRASWEPVAQVCVYASAGGGEHRNTLSSLMEVSRFMLPYFAYGNSHIPLTVDGGLRVGPFAGASLQLFGGYAVANDWLMPLATIRYGSLFREINIKGWRAGAAVTYNNRRWGTARLSYECAPHSEEHAWYEWRDRARQVVTANLTVTPLRRLAVDVEYQFRSGRRLLCENAGYGGVFIPEMVVRREILTPGGIVSTLNLGATYGLTSDFSVFARGENILNRRYNHIGLVESQGTSALVGITYQF